MLQFSNALLSAHVNQLDRIAKVIAYRSDASRREAEALIAAGRVKIDNQIVASPITKVTYDAHITIDNVPLKPFDQTRIYIFHKPLRTLCTKHDELGRPTIYDILPKECKHLKYIGRLDFMSEGLLLMTNDGELAQRLTLPSSKIDRVYNVRVFGINDAAKLTALLKKPLRINGITYNIKHFSVLERSGANAWVNIVLTEGKNREIRKIFDYLNLQISKLIRLNYGPYSLGRLKRGEIKEVKLLVV
jgi:23S rRNA pseudouridine2605 synthase